jgi:hypothetical protein
MDFPRKPERDFPDKTEKKDDESTNKEEFQCHTKSLLLGEEPVRRYSCFLSSTI